MACATSKAVGTCGSRRRNESASNHAEESIAVSRGEDDGTIQGAGERIKQQYFFARDSTKVRCPASGLQRQDHTCRIGRNTDRRASHDSLEWDLVAGPRSVSRQRQSGDRQDEGQEFVQCVRDV